MLEWMQRHKKWLVVTIWISVIALVSAGMVGWNPSGFSLTGDQVAKVGSVKISQQEFAFTYKKIFNEYNQMLGGNLDEAEAKKLGLDKVTLNQLIQRAQLQNFAKDLGLRVKDSEVVDAIVKDPSFQTEGHFSDKLYRQLLKENNIPVKFFEESIRSSLLINKLLTLIPISINSLEQESIGATLALTDTIRYEIFKPVAPQKPITAEMLKDFWQNHKSEYVNPPKLTLRLISVPILTQKFTDKDLLHLYNEDKTLYLDEKGQLQDFSKVKDKVQHDFQSQQAKKDALRLGKELKNDSTQIQAQDLSITLDENAPKELAAQFNDLQEGQITKPFLFNHSYAVGKVTKKTPEQPKTFEQAKSEISDKLKSEISMQELQERAKNSLQNLQGKSATINHIQNPKIAPLTEQQAQFVIRNIFAKNSKSGVIMLDKSAFAYTITRQDLPRHLPEGLMNLIQNIKSQSIDSALIQYLNQHYPAKYYPKNLELGANIGQ